MLTAENFFYQLQKVVRPVSVQLTSLSDLQATPLYKKLNQEYFHFREVVKIYERMTIFIVLCIKKQYRDMKVIFLKRDKVGTLLLFIFCSKIHKSELNINLLSSNLFVDYI